MSDPTGLGIEHPATTLIAAGSGAAAAPAIPVPPASRMIVPHPQPTTSNGETPPAPAD